MLTRLELFVIVRNQVKDRTLLRRALAVEAIMEVVARLCGQEPTLFALLGLGANIDAELCAKNPEKRGEVAAELLAVEGAPPDVVAATRDRLRVAPEDLGPLAAALCLSEALAGEFFRALDVGCCDTLETLDARSIARRMERAAEKRGEPQALAAVACARRLALPLTELAQDAHAALLRVRGDLHL
jgi:predicted hydrolase (HD superfamily)